jgi:hypothetical protein
MILQEPPLSSRNSSESINALPGANRTRALERAKSQSLYLLDKKLQGAAIDWSKDPQLAVLQNGIQPGFFRLFEQGVRQYLAGDWQSAVATLKQVQEKFAADDGPSHVWMRIISFFHIMMSRVS